MTVADFYILMMMKDIWQKIRYLVHVFFIILKMYFVVTTHTWLCTFVAQISVNSSNDDIQKQMKNMNFFRFYNN